MHAQTAKYPVLTIIAVWCQKADRDKTAMSRRVEKMFYSHNFSARNSVCLSVYPSVRPSVRHTGNPRLKGSVCHNMLCTRRSTDAFSLLRQTSQCRVQGFTPNEAVK